MSQLEASNDEHLQTALEIETETSAMATTMSSTTTVTQSTIDTQASTAATTSTTTSNTTAPALEVLTTALLEADAVDLPEPISVSPVQTSLAAEEVVTTRYFPPSPPDSNVDINNNNIDNNNNNQNMSATITNGINIISSNIVSNNMGNNNLNSNNNISNNNSSHHYNNNTSPNMANSRTNGFAHEFNSFSATEVLATTQPGNGDLVVCNQALSNVCVYHFVPVDELEQSGDNLNANNNNNNNIGNNNTHHHNNNNNSYMNTNIRPNNPYSPYFNGSLSNGYPHNSIDDHGPQHPNNAEHLRRSQRRRERNRSRRSSRRDKESMRHSLKSMNNFLRKTVNTLRRIKSLILQQVQIARALHLGSQLTMW